MKIFQKLSIAALALVMSVSGLLGLTPQTANAFSGAGAGTAGSPYVITSCAQLQEMKDSLAAYYELGSNVNCDVAPYNTGSGFAPVGGSSTPFTGSLAGNGYTISGLFINRPSTDNVGLFGFMSTGAAIANVGLVGVNVTGQTYTGGLVGFKNAGTVEGSYSKGTVAGNRNVGGLIGINNSLIKTSYSAATASSSGMSGDVGGLVGMNNGTIQDSYATGNVSGSNDNVFGGGLVGLANMGTIQNSYATGNVSVTGEGGSNAGGLVGVGNGTIQNSYATGTATAAEGDANDGGFVGNTSASITNSFSVGASPVGSGSSTGVTGGQSLSSFYQTDPLKAVYTGTPPWDFGGDVWHFANTSSLPILEAVQPPVTNAVLGNAVNGKPVSITTPAGTNITCDSVLKDSDTAKHDTGYLYPDGLVKFCFDTSSSSNQVTLVFTTSLVPGQVVVRKYNSVTQTYATINDATVTATTYNGQPALSVTYDIVDNGPLDENPAVGAITDPVGLAVPNTPLPAAPETGHGSNSQPNAIAIILAAGATIALAGGSRLLYKSSSRPA